MPRARVGDLELCYDQDGAGEPVLLLMGLRPDTWLHLVYGFGPLIILGIGHLMSREISRGHVGGQRWAQPWVVFTAASFVCFGLSLRALSTGLGPG